MPENEQPLGPYPPNAGPVYQNSYHQGGYVPNGPGMPPTTPPGGPGPGRKRSGARTGAIAGLTLVMALVLGIGLFAGWQFGRTATTDAVPGLNNSTLQPGSNPQAPIPSLSGNNIQSVREAVVGRTRPAVVQITVHTQKGDALGSGVIIDKRGYIVTNNHVVSGVNVVDEVVLSDGTRIRNAQVVGTDPADDLAIIKITPPTNMAVIALGDSSQLRVGQDVLAIGNPLGNTQTVTNGIVSALGRNVSEGNGATIPNAIQTDAPINPGNSGGALVDLQGQLVGIPTLTAVDPEFNSPANGVGFAIPSNRVQFIATQLIATGQVQHTGRAAIGILPTAVDATLQMQDNLAVDHGVYVTQLVSGGAAEKAGMKTGDVIVQIDNKAIDAIPTLEDALIAKNPGDTAKVTVYRGTQKIDFTVTLGELKAK
ncbi:protease [Dictyobacter vulcani]|uniref:Protease n=2 Tax=Dictyobacter vulcani TaxID=2607529 RepID=A0A5J4KLJ6_9CHLR|nr:protease [Dictyobacter vulcani]